MKEKIAKAQEEGKKYIVTDVRSDRGYQIMAVKEFTTIDGSVVKPGDKGGYVTSESNLRHEGNCWIAENGGVFDFARVSGNALVTGKSKMYMFSDVSENAIIKGDTTIGGGVKVFGNAEIDGKGVKILDSVKIYGDAKVSCDGWIEGKVRIHGDEKVGGIVQMRGDFERYGTKRSETNELPWFTYTDNTMTSHKRIFSSKFTDDFFTEVSRSIAFGDCSGETVDKIYYKGKEIKYVGWQQGMKFEYKDLDGNTVWVGVFEHWDH